MKENTDERMLFDKMWIKNRIAVIGFSQQQVMDTLFDSATIHTRRVLWGKLLNNKTKNLSLVLLKKICDVLACSPNDLFVTDKLIEKKLSIRQPDLTAKKKEVLRKCMAKSQRKIRNKKYKADEYKNYYSKRPIINRDVEVITNKGRELILYRWKGDDYCWRDDANALLEGEKVMKWRYHKKIK